MTWQNKVEQKVKDTEEDIESFLPRRYAAKFKIFLDRFLPYSLILLGLLIGLNFVGDLQPSTARMINILNWLLVSYFSLRVAMAFRLAESDREFLKQHWFDALLIIPAFTLIQELRILKVLEEVKIGGEAATGTLATQNAGIAAQLTKIIKIIKRSISF